MMRRFVTLFMVLVAVSSAFTPAVLAGKEVKGGGDSDISSIAEYQEELAKLNNDIAKIYLEINGPRSLEGSSNYVHLIDTLEDSAELIGRTNRLVNSMTSYTGSETSLAELLLDVSVNGFSDEMRDKLIQAGYSSADIELLELKVMEYNAYVFRVSTKGFTEEEVQAFKDIGYSQDEIDDLQIKIGQRYFSVLTPAEQLNASKNELYQIQVSLSVLSLKMLAESSDEHGSISSEQIAHLGMLEERLVRDISDLDSTVKWEHVRNSGREVFKFSEMLVKKSGDESYSVDYFVGLQVYLAALTALAGDEDFALSVIDSYRLVLGDLAEKNGAVGNGDVKPNVSGEAGKGSKSQAKIASNLRSSANAFSYGFYKISTGLTSLVVRVVGKIFDSIFSIPIVGAVSSSIVGQVDELREDNNIAEVTVTLANPSEPEFSRILPLGFIVYLPGGGMMELPALGQSIAEIIALLSELSLSVVAASTGAIFLLLVPAVDAPVINEVEIASWECVYVAYMNPDDPDQLILTIAGNAVDANEFLKIAEDYGYGSPPNKPLSDIKGTSDETGILRELAAKHTVESLENVKLTKILNNGPFDFMGWKGNTLHLVESGNHDLFGKSSLFDKFIRYLDENFIPKNTQFKLHIQPYGNDASESEIQRFIDAVNGELEKRGFKNKITRKDIKTYSDTPNTNYDRSWC